MQGTETAPVLAAEAELVAQRQQGDRLSTGFSGRRGRLFGLVLWTGILTVLTLGLYRFWQKTRLRRWYWSAIRPGGHPLEYVGDPFEKLLGFLIAVVILAFYIGIVNLALMFVSFSLFQGNFSAYALSLFGVLPLWFFAQYRARRYILARTRWRGLRFGLEPGAWGYALRAMWHGLLTLLTFGLLWPRMTYKLEKYRTDRTWYGDQKMEQDGGWGTLYGALRWHVVALGCLVFAAIVALAGAVPVAITLSGLAGLLLLYGLVYYRVDTRRRLTAGKRLGALRFRLEASPLHVFLVLFFGYLSTLFLAAVPTGFLALLFAELQQLELFGAPDVGEIAPALEDASVWVLIGLSIMSYFAIFLVWSAVSQALVVMPLTRHYARSLVIEGGETLDRVQQRPRDAHMEAEGFADALDVGASL